MGIDFGKEIEKFQSLLSVNDLYSILQFKDYESHDNFPYEAFWHFKEYTLGIRVNDAPFGTTVYIWEKELGTADVEERAQLCFLFAKFYDKLKLNCN
jgi:hypothetical protein